MVKLSFKNLSVEEQYEIIKNLSVEEKFEIVKSRNFSRYDMIVADLSAPTLTGADLTGVITEINVLTF